MQFVKPVAGTYTDGFGPRGNVPGVGDMGAHTGLDIAAPAGTPIFAAAPGTVARKWFERDYGGHMVEVNHGGDWATRYAHMLNASHLSIGSTVHYETAIGTVGSTGAANGAHCHFEILFNWGFVDPWLYLEGDLELDAATLKKINETHANVKQVHSLLNTLINVGYERQGTDAKGQPRTGRQSLKGFLSTWHEQLGIDRRRAERDEARGQLLVPRTAEIAKDVKTLLERG